MADPTDYSDYPGVQHPDGSAYEGMKRRADNPTSSHSRGDAMIIKGRTENARDQMDYRQSNQKLIRGKY